MSPQYQQMYQERQKALEEAFAPQIKGLQEQISALPQQFEAQKSALQQAKENAFRDITKTASRGGMFFTGFTPREQARYLGERFLPGLQQLGAQETSARQGLLGQIAQIQGQQRLGGLSFLDQLTAMQRADEQEARAAARARAGSGGFGGIDFSLPPEEQPPAPQPAAGVSAEEQWKLDTVGKYKTMMQRNDRTQIRNTINELNRRLNTQISEQERAAINNELQIITGVAKELNFDLTRLNPSRVENVLANPVVNRLTLTPNEYINQIKTNINNVKRAYNWLFGPQK